MGQVLGAAGLCYVDNRYRSGFACCRPTHGWKLKQASGVLLLISTSIIVTKLLNEDERNIRRNDFSRKTTKCFGWNRFKKQNHPITCNEGTEGR